MEFDMEIKTLGKFVLTQDKAFRTSISAFTILQGSVISVTQIDYKNNQFYSPEIGDWTHWEQPFEPANIKEFERLESAYKI